MARGVNKVILVGNLGRDPETRYLPSGGAVTNASVATSNQWRDRDSGENKERTEWHRVVFFNRLAEIGFALLVMFGYAQVLPVLGFVFATVIITAYLTWRLGAGPLTAILNGVGTSVGLFVLFELIFGLSLADGPLGF